MFQTKVVEKIKTGILYSVPFFENRAVYEIMWRNVVERGRAQMTIQSMRIACWIPKATDTHTYVYTHTNTHTPDTQYLLLFYGNNGYANAPQAYVICT